MKIRLLTSSIMASLVLYGCSSNQQSTQSEIIQIDVTKNYPEKEIKLTDIAEVSYVRFEADEDEYLFQGNPVSVTENNIVVLSSRTGNFYFFSKEGKPKSTFNRTGNGPEEYTYIRRAVYDEEADELYAHGFNNILVYSSKGEYKRTLSLPKNITINDLVLFDNQSLLLFDNHLMMDITNNKLNSLINSENNSNDEFKEKRDVFDSPFVRISREDGSIIDYINVPADSTVQLTVPVEDNGAIIGIRTGAANRILNAKNGFFLCNQETGRVFFYDENLTLIPVLEQKPAVSTLEPIIYINNLVETNNYQFIETIALKGENARFPSTYLIRDKKEGSFYKQKIILDDFKGKEINISPSTVGTTRNAQIGYIPLALDELKEAYANDKLSGELKDLVASMDEEENDIYVLLDFK